MSQRHRFLPVIFLTVLGVSVTAVGLAWNFAPAFGQTTLTVTTADLTNAGFTKVTQITPSGNLYAPPNKYYTVDGGDALTVLFRPMEDSKFVYNNGQPQTLPMGNETQIRDSRPGYYIVVTGVNQDEMAKLVSILKTKTK